MTERLMTAYVHKVYDVKWILVGVDVTVSCKMFYRGTVSHTNTKREMNTVQ